MSTPRHSPLRTLARWSLSPFFLLPPLLLSSPGLSAQVTYTVNTVNDVDDGVCSPVHCSLREALGFAISEPGGATVAFDLRGSGPHTIRPTSPLPFIESNVIIDGTTEPDFAGTPVVELDGSLAGPAHGLELVGSNNLIRGLVINRFEWNGIQIHVDGSNNVIEGNFIGTDITGTLDFGMVVGVSIGDAFENTVGGTTAEARNLISGNIEGITIVGVSASGNIVQGNYLGTDVTGTSAIPNDQGILLLAPGNTIGGEAAGTGNLISGNTASGISLGAPNATGNVIQGNLIGVDASGNAALGNDIGVWVDNVPANTIGGTSAGAGNVISGNREGITLWESGATGNLVQGNYVGTNIEGDAAIPNETGIPVYSPANTIGGMEEGAGNLVSGNLVNGVNFYGDEASGNIVQGNLIGTDASGTVALGNGEAGVGIHQAANQNTIGGADSGARNLISGNTFGVLIGDLISIGSRIQGNYIGTDVSGTAAIPNAQSGVLVWGQDTQIGGVEEGTGNVISGNTFAGIDLGGGSTGTAIQGNHIGTDATGTAALGNDLGIFVNFSPGNTIGGTESGAGNVISGNLSNGVTVNGVDASGNTFLGNFFGTDATGTARLGNDIGIFFLDAPDNTVGGAAPGAGNIISGNTRNGIRMVGPEATGNTFLGNSIGTDATGALDLGNGTAGIVMGNQASDNIIGSTEAGGGNTVRFNGRGGIVTTVNTGLSNQIRSNSVFGNERLGIDLANDLVTSNDETDSDTGPNDLQNYPSLTSVVSNGNAAIQATLNSTPNSSFSLDFFSSPTCDDSGYGEGLTPLGSTAVTTDAGGSGTVTTSFSNVVDHVFTATATDDAGNTSEFSACGALSTIEVTPSPTTQTVSAGQAAGYTVSVSTTGGTIEGTVSLVCSGNPSTTTCSFAQDQVTLVSGEATTTMTVTTVAPGASEPLVPENNPTGPPGWWLAVLLATGGLVVFGRGGRFRARRWDLIAHPLPRMATRVAVVGLLLLVPASCGDDGKRPPTGGTPPGSYELTVTGSWESIQASSTLTLVVQ